jgi:hypothetical protein
MKIAIILLSALLLSGCAGFSGKRSISLKLTILANTFEWSSTCDGAYPEKEPVP